MSCHDMSCHVDLFYSFAFLPFSALSKDSTIRLLLQNCLTIIPFSGCSGLKKRVIARRITLVEWMEIFSVSGFAQRVPFVLAEAHSTGLDASLDHVRVGMPSLLRSITTREKDCRGAVLPRESNPLQTGHILGMSKNTRLNTQTAVSTELVSKNT